MTRGIEAGRAALCAAFAAAWMLAACDGATPGSTPPASAARGPTPDAAAAGAQGSPLAALRTELEAARAQQRETDAQLAATRAELAESEARRIDREREWLVYSNLLAKLPPARLPGGKPFALEAAEAAPAADAPAPAPLDPQLQARSLEIARALRTLFTLEQIRSLGLLECGTLDGNAIGPVVLRELDGQGRFAGSLYANRLRMEGSRAARTLTLLLEDGYETRGGERIAFDAGGGTGACSRRIVLEGVDPVAWAGEFRELFGEAGLDLSGDDGLWDLAGVKRELNALLEAQPAGGTYRLRALGGIQDGVLLDVHLERCNEKGDVDRRLFADRLRIARARGGIELTLESGVQVRGQDERVPFLDGRYRILLPGADAGAWTRANLPGLAPPPAAADPAQSH